MPLDQFAAAVAGTQIGQGGGAVGKRHTALEADGDGRQRVRDVVPAGQLEADLGAFAAGEGGEEDTFEAVVDDLLGADLRAPVDAIENIALAQPAAESGDVGVVGIEECEAILGERGDELVLGARDAGDAVGKVLEVHRRDVRDDAPVGLGDVCERGNLAGVVHAHFDDGEVVFGLELE